MLRMELGTSHPHCQRCLGSTVVQTLLFLRLSYSLDQASNYSHFSANSLLQLEGGSELGKGGGVGDACDWVSPPPCCSTHDKPLLFYQDLPSLACLSQIAALFSSPCRSPALRCPTPWPTFDPQVRQPYATRVGSELRRSLAGQVEPDERGRAPREWRANTPPACCE